MKRTPFHRSTSSLLAIPLGIGLAAAFLAPAAAQGGAQGNQNRPAPIELVKYNAMANPYRMLPGWPKLGTIKPGAAIGIVPDGKGGVWLQHRSDPGILHLDAAGNITRRFEGVIFSQAHGMCRDRDGNFRAADSGPFGDGPDVGVRGNQVFKYSPDGKRLLTLGQSGVGKAGRDTFIQGVPTWCD